MIRTWGILLGLLVGCASSGTTPPTGALPDARPPEPDTATVSPATPALAGPVRVTLAAGGGIGADGVAAVQGKITEPFAVDFDSAGNMYIAEMTGERIRKVDPKGVLSTVVGNGMRGAGGDDGPAKDAQIYGSHHLLVAPNDDLYIADTWNNRVRKVDAKTGVITTIAGTGQKGFSGDGGPATAAQLGGVYCIAADAAWQRLYVADLDNRRIRMITLGTGVISTVAGNGRTGKPLDGADALSQPLLDPRAVTVDGRGTIYVLERNGHALRAVGGDGKIRTVAGTGVKGFSGDGGDALQATFNGPKHVSMDRDGTVLIADTENHAIRRYSPEGGKVTLVAGTGKAGTGGVPGPPEQAQLARPHGAMPDGKGGLWISDSDNGRVLRLER